MKNEIKLHRYYELFETEWGKYLDSQTETKSLENLEKRIKLEL